MKKELVFAIYYFDKCLEQFLYLPETITRTPHSSMPFSSKFLFSLAQKSKFFSNFLNRFLIFISFNTYVLKFLRHYPLITLCSGNYQIDPEHSRTPPNRKFCIYITVQIFNKINTFYKITVKVWRFSVEKIDATTKRF